MAGGFWGDEPRHSRVEKEGEALFRRVQEQIPAFAFPFVHSSHDGKPHIFIDLTSPQLDLEAAQHFMELLSLWQDQSSDCLPQGLIISQVGVLDRGANLFEQWARRLRLPLIAAIPVTDEEEVLQVRALGASSFILQADSMDYVALQYLIEIGREHGMEGIIAVSDRDDWETAMKTDAMLILVGSREQQVSYQTRLKKPDIRAVKRFFIASEKPGEGQDYVLLMGPEQWLKGLSAETY